MRTSQEATAVVLELAHLRLHPSFFIFLELGPRQIIIVHRLILGHDSQLLQFPRNNRRVLVVHTLLEALTRVLLLAIVIFVLPLVFDIVGSLSLQLLHLFLIWLLLLVLFAFFFAHFFFELGELHQTILLIPSVLLLIGQYLLVDRYLLGVRVLQSIQLCLLLSLVLVFRSLDGFDFREVQPELSLKHFLDLRGRLLGVRWLVRRLWLLFLQVCILILIFFSFIQIIVSGGIQNFRLFPNSFLFRFRLSSLFLNHLIGLLCLH